MYFVIVGKVPYVRIFIHIFTKCFFFQRSTEQLTHCSTATLEEILDNSDGVTTRTVSEKIMSICKNTIRWVLFLDILLALSGLNIFLFLFS